MSGELIIANIALKEKWLSSGGSGYQGNQRDAAGNLSLVCGRNRAAKLMENINTGQGPVSVFLK